MFKSMSKAIALLCTVITTAVIIFPTNTAHAFWDYGAELYSDPIPEGVITISSTYYTKTYDGHGRILQHQFCNAYSPTEIYAVDYIYDAENKLVKKQYSSNYGYDSTLFSYNNDGKLSEITEIYNGSTTQTQSHPVLWDENGNLFCIGDTWFYQYDELGRCIAMCPNTEIPPTIIAYDDMGNVKLRNTYGLDCDDIMQYVRDSSGKLLSIDVTCPACCTSMPETARIYVNSLFEKTNDYDFNQYLTYKYAYHYNELNQISFVTIEMDGNILDTLVYTYAY